MITIHNTHLSLILCSLTDFIGKYLIKSILSILFLAGLLFSTNNQVLAAPCPSARTFDCAQGCTDLNDCGPGGRLCVITGSSVTPSGAACGGGIGSWVVGPIAPPKGVAAFNAQTGVNGIGILLFVSNALKFFAVLCGLLVFFNILYAGYEYIVGAGKTDVHVKVRERLTWSVIGLILLIGAYMIAAIIGLLIFGDATFILNPKLSEYGALAP